MLFSSSPLEEVRSIPQRQQQEQKIRCSPLAFGSNGHTRNLWGRKASAKTPTVSSNVCSDSSGFSDWCDDSGFFAMTLPRERSMGASSSDGPAKPELNRKKKHLVIMCNGLFGSTQNWTVVEGKLRRTMNARDTLLVVSTSNQFLETFDGIDKCGERLAEEIRDQKSQNADLEQISVLGHSMGGLIARYAVGRLYDPETDSICGMKPAHFVTLACPHLGCDGDGPAQANWHTTTLQVPFIGWTGTVPLAGQPLQRVLQVAAKPVASFALRRTGAQFFKNDCEQGKEPLLVRMSKDVPGEGYYWSALRSFGTRTCYANSSGDHLVGWANSSLRLPTELPVFPEGTGGKGVIREDPPEAAWSILGAARLPKGLPPSSPSGSGRLRIVSPPERGGHRGEQPSIGRPFSPSTSAVDAKSPERSNGRSASTAEDSGDCKSTPPSSPLPASDHAQPVPSPQPVAVRVACRAADGEDSDSPRAPTDSIPPFLAPGAAIQTAPRPAAAAAAEKAVEEKGQAAAGGAATASLQILESLKDMPWRRVDVCFKGTSLPFFAHNHIQVTRQWLNWHGDAVAQHLANELAALDKKRRVQED